jgi:NTP pyrophosphatase (non-canonical NTP hydrolase)
MSDDSGNGYTFDEYQRVSREHLDTPQAAYPKIRISIDGGPLIDAPWLYPLVAMCGETGELAEKVKKLIRDDGGLVTPARLEMMQLEVGDIQWYLARFAEAVGTKLSTAARMNVEKIRARLARGTLQGSGDTR